MSQQTRNMSADKNMTPETTFLPPDGLKQRFLGLAHPLTLLFQPFWSTFGQNHGKVGKSMKTQENPVSKGNPGFLGDFRCLAQERLMSIPDQKMSAVTNMTPETTFLRPDALERRF